MTSPAPGASIRLSRLRSSAAYRFRESLFLLPAVMVVVGVVVAEVAVAVDDVLDPAPVWLLDMSSNAATWLLSTVAGATITTAGVVVSLMLVSLQLASSQFSPRVMRTYIRDRMSQVVIGVIVATFVQCVLTLRHVSAVPEDPAPPVALTLSVVLAIASVLFIVAHVDHLARRMQVGNVLRVTAGEGARVIADVDAAARGETPVDMVEVPDEDRLVARAPQDGWVTHALGADLLRLVPPGTTVRLETRPGAYIHEGEPVAVLHPRPDDDETVRSVVASVGVSSSRTMQEDIDFALRQVVDIGLRALSDNDPTTAVEATLRVGSLLRRLLLARLPADAVGGPQGRTLVRPWHLDHAELVGHGLDQLRQAAADQPQVLAALVRVVRMLIDHVTEHGRTEHLPVLQSQLDLLRAVVRAGDGVLPSDVEHLLEISDDDVDPAEHEARG